jgi:hypothetical protein
VPRVWVLDADAAGVLQMAADGKGGEYDGQVSLDRLAFVVENGDCRGQ